MKVEGRRIEPQSCPQCLQIQDKGREKQVPLRCRHCFLPLRLIGGRYRVVSLLNEGNFAWIYRALDVLSETEEERAIKLFKHGVLNALTTKLRFLREVRVTTQLGHKTEHIVKIFDAFGEEDDLGFFYAMELLKGSSLDEFLIDGVPLERPLTFHVVQQTCEALAVAHQDGVIHRDLKPENIFLMEQDESDSLFVKIIDFGIAKHFSTAHRYLTQNVIGTPLFMSPEQCLSEEIDGRSDQYAVAMLLYRCLTGRIPFGIAEDDYPSYRRWMLAIMDAHISSPPRSMLSTRPDLCFLPALDRVILKALSKDPNDRFVSIEAFWEAIKPFQMS